MHNVTKLLLLIVLNTFLMMFSSIVYEYNDLSSRFTTLENAVDTSLDSAIEASVASEEMFGPEYNASLISNSIKTAGTGILYYCDGRWNRVNTYALAMYLDENDHFPTTRGQLTTAELRLYGNLQPNFKVGGSLENTAKNLIYTPQYNVFTWLYGKVNCSYNNSALSWANRNYYTSERYKELCNNSAKLTSNATANDRAREATDDFYDYYEKVGHRAIAMSDLQVRKDDTYEVETDRDGYPILAQMGLNLSELNKVKSNTTLPTFTNVVKIGKSANNNENLTSLYFLTPASLGVTYVPTKVLYPTFRTMLDTTIRLQRINSVIKNNNSRAYKQADGCVSTDLYVNGTAHQKHHRNIDEKIVNDGDIEYDLNSIKVRVDYRYINLYDTRFAVTACNLFGVNPKVTSHTDTGDITHNALGQTVNELLSADTGFQHYMSQLIYGEDSIGLSDAFDMASRLSGGSRIVAKVSVKLNIHVPYHSSILQWGRYIKAQREPGGVNANVHHYSIRLATKDDNITAKNDSLVYQYSKYYVTSR